MTRSVRLCTAFSACLTFNLRHQSTMAALSAMNSSSSLPFPSIGWGSFGLERSSASASLSAAIRLGYRRIDCAPVYFNEDVIGDALHNILEVEKLVERKDLYIVSKLASPFHRKEHVELAVRKTLNDLRIDYLDLYLIHWPVAFNFVPIDLSQRGFVDEEIDDSGDGNRIDPSVSVHETWEAMEQMVEKGLVKNIGVSNFPVMLLHELLAKARIKPLVNQCEAHPYLPNTKLMNYCKHRGVHFQAYSPLGTPGFKEDGEPTILDDPVLQRIAESHDASVPQVCLAWALQRNTSVVVKASSESHLESNMKALDVRLSKEDIHSVEELGRRNYRFFRPEEWWGEASMAVFD